MAAFLRIFGRYRKKAVVTADSEYSEDSFYFQDGTVFTFQDGTDFEFN